MKTFALAVLYVFTALLPGGMSAYAVIGPGPAMPTNPANIVAAPLEHRPSTLIPAQARDQSNVPRPTLGLSLLGVLLAIGAAALVASVPILAAVMGAGAIVASVVARIRQRRTSSRPLSKWLAIAAGVVGTIAMIFGIGRVVVDE